jgi:hypothetical protein
MKKASWRENGNGGENGGNGAAPKRKLSGVKMKLKKAAKKMTAIRREACEAAAHGAASEKRKALERKLASKL